jgi:hypothetical protein
MEGCDPARAGNLTREAEVEPIIGRTDVTKVNLLAMLGGALALALAATAGVAAPFSQGADATLRAAATLNSIEHVHGTHRACRLGRVPRWGGVVRWHRHVGPRNLPVRC